MHVVVLGAGMSGLASALLLRRAGHDVTVLSDKRVQATTSHLAAAVWFPTAAGPPEKVARWGEETYSVLAAEAADGHPGVTMLESLTLYREEPDEPDWAKSVGDVRPATSEELPPGYAHGLRFVVPLVEMPTYLPGLLRRAGSIGVNYVAERVHRLDDLLSWRPDLIVNAAGMAAGPLVGDDSTYPVRGQIVRVRNPGLSTSVRDEKHPAGRAYVHPRSNDCILGGTFDVGEWDDTPDPFETKAILDRCTDIVPALAGAEVIESVVGLRPGRPEVRLETDTDLLPVPVIHNYGHGGSGITIGWGCAAEVAGLANKLAK